MPDDKPKGRPTRLRITSCTQVYQGQNSRGDQYTIYEIEAVKGDGEAVKEKLRSFENLPLEILDLTVVPYRSAKHGLSYTLSQRSKPNNSKRISELDDEVGKLKSRVAALEEKNKKPADWQGDPDLQPSYGDIPV